MKISHSILFSSAFFCVFLAIGMEAAAGSNPASGPAQEGNSARQDTTDCHSVQDMRLLLLYHNPATRRLPDSCRSTRPDAPRGHPEAIGNGLPARIE